MIAGLVAVLAAACGGGASSATSDASPVAANVTPPPGTTLRVAEQFTTISLALQLSGQDRDLPFSPQFADFVGGPAVTQALEADAVDIGILGDVPTVLPQASRSDLVAIAASKNSGNTYGVVSRPGEKIDGIAGLRGKKVAYTEGTGPQGFLLEALAANGLKPSDVELVNIANQKNVTAALKSGSIDAAALTDPIIPQYLAQNPTASLVTRSGPYESGYSYLVTSKKTLKDPAKVAAIASFLQHYIRAEQWENTHQADWVQAYYVGKQKVSAEVGNDVYRNAGPSTFPVLDQSVFDAQQKLADLLADNDVIPKKLDATKEFDTRFNDVVKAVT